MRLLLLVCTACGRLAFDPLATPGTDGGGDDAGAQTIHVVQVAGPNIVSNVTSTSVTFVDAPVIGNVIVVWVWTFKAGASSFDGTNVSDNLTNTYEMAVADNEAQGACDGATGTAAVAVFSTYVTMSGVFTVSVTPTGGPSQQIGLVAIEYEGLAGIVDATAHLETTGTASPMTFTSGTIVTTPGDRLIAAVGDTCSGFPNTDTWMETSGFTVRAMTGNTTTAQPGIATELITNVPGTHSDAWALEYTGSGPDPGIGAIVAFR